MAEQFDYAGLRGTADRLIIKFGRTLTLFTEQRSGPAHDPVITHPEVAAVGVVLDYKDRDVDGTVIQQSDRKVLLKVGDLDAVPALGDKIAIGARSYSIVNVKELNPGGTTLLYELQVRL